MIMMKEMMIMKEGEASMMGKALKIIKIKMTNSSLQAVLNDSFFIYIIYSFKKKTELITKHHQLFKLYYYGTNIF